MQIPRLVPRPVKAGRQAEGSSSRVSEGLVKSAALSCEGGGGEVHSSVAQVIEKEALPRTHVTHVEDLSQAALMYLEMVPSLSYTGRSRCLCVRDSQCSCGPAHWRRGLNLAFHVPILGNAAQFCAESEARWSEC